MKLSLVGMSGIGKTYWSKQLEDHGFKSFCCDDLIEKELEKEFQMFHYKGTKGLSEWMGQPYDTRYAKNSQKYLNLEREVMHTVLSYVEQATDAENIVIDTTGSVIYIDDYLLSRLSKLTTVIYLKTSESSLKEMFETFCRVPKPIFWGDSFNKQKGETDQEALKRCYPKLLAWRETQYQRLADITLHDHQLFDTTFTIDSFHKTITSYDFV